MTVKTAVAPKKKNWCRRLAVLLRFQRDSCKSGPGEDRGPLTARPLEEAPVSCDLSGRDECFLFGPTRLTQQAAGVNGKQPEWTLLNTTVNVAGKSANKRDKHGGAVNRAHPEGLLYFMGMFAESFFFFFWGGAQILRS